MEVSKFKIGNNIIDVKDAQARDDVVAAMNAAQDAQSTADLKQDADDALKVGTVNATFSNITFSANGGVHAFDVPIPEGVNNARPVFARCLTTQPLVCSTLYTLAPNMVVHLRNVSNAALTLDSIGVNVTYLYK